MFQELNCRENLSLRLSEVLHDIGTNERMVMRRRRYVMLKETIDNVINRSINKGATSYFPGSQIEGTTTRGLCSDLDNLICVDKFNIIQDRSEWEHDMINYLVIQDENTTPGYCFLQLIRTDELRSSTFLPNDKHIIDRIGRILLTNKIGNQGAVRHGPSITTQGIPGLRDGDSVQAYPYKSWPQSASGWLDGQGIGRWPSQEMRRYAASTGCFVVPVGSKVSKYPELEWRISTILAERCLMFSLNITQIRCCVLLKMILKSFLNPQGTINVSSFMCKTVLLHCIENTDSSLWEENNLFTCLKYCLLELHSCVQNDCCSHFIIPENNLMAGQFSVGTKHELSKNISEFLQNAREMLLRIDIDDLGQRLQVKLNMKPYLAFFIPSFLEIYEDELTELNVCLAGNICTQHLNFLEECHNKSITTIKQYVDKLMTFSDDGSRLQQTACKFVTPLIYTTYGSILASSSIGENNEVSPEALRWLSAGLNSDISSRVKLASVFYSSGDIEKAESILRDTEQQYYSYPVASICGCLVRPPPAVTAEFKRICREQSEDCIKQITAFCVKFIQEEINCVPHELQYEMFRSTQDDMIHREMMEIVWMDYAVVDSLPFLYFLQYKIYRHLQRHQDQQQALDKLVRTIATHKNLEHGETALNILGQCMEQENRPQQALKYYLLSRRKRPRNNAAKVHICKLLSRILARQSNEVKA